MEDDDSNHGSGSGETLNHQTHHPHTLTKSRKLDSSFQYHHHEEEEKQDEDDNTDEVWKPLNDGFRQVQSVLNRNRVLIQQVNDNHRSKIYSNMVKNVALIQEINANISKIVSIYSDLSSDFSTVFHHHHRPAADASGGGDGDGGGNCVDNSSD